MGISVNFENETMIVDKTAQRWLATYMIAAGRGESSPSTSSGLAARGGGRGNQKFVRKVVRWKRVDKIIKAKSPFPDFVTDIAVNTAVENAGNIRYQDNSNSIPFGGSEWHNPFPQNTDMAMAFNNLRGLWSQDKAKPFALMIMGAIFDDARKAGKFTSSVYAGVVLLDKKSARKINGGNDIYYACKLTFALSGCQISEEEARNVKSAIDIGEDAYDFGWEDVG